VPAPRFPVAEDQLLALLQMERPAPVVVVEGS
jgi:hypothetical protein